MANVKDIRMQKVPVDLDKRRHLVYDLNSFAELEERFGSIDEAMEEIRKGKIKSIRLVLWLGLLNDDPELTEQQTGSIILIPELPMLTDKIFEAIGVSLPEPEEEDEIDSGIEITDGDDTEKKE